MNRLTLIACLITAPLAAQGQSFEDAVRANVALATTLCAKAMMQGASPSTVFGNAGFVYRGVDRGVNEYGISRGTGHYFDAPAQTAKAEVMNPDGHPALCTVSTTHMTQSELSSLVASVLHRDFSGVEPQGADQWFIRNHTGLPLIISTSTIGTNHRYEAPGTVTVGMSFPG